MRAWRRVLKGALLLAVLGAASTEATAADRLDCGALDQLYRTARTDFPALREKSFEAASCLQRRNQFRCTWSFPSDTYAMAEVQASRLRQCTAALPRAEPLEAKHSVTEFRINPETVVDIEGPTLDSGSWTIALRISSSADWR